MANLVAREDSSPQSCGGSGEGGALLEIPAHTLVVLCKHPSAFVLQFPSPRLRRVRFELNPSPVKQLCHGAQAIIARETVLIFISIVYRQL